jgi:Fe-S-cluster containining protein
MVIKLNKSYPCIYGLPVIHSVDTEIFRLKYYMHCMQCTFCHDQCCFFGADIDMVSVDRIMKYKKELETYTGIKSRYWFYPNKRKWDHEYPGHVYTRTTKRKNACIFLNKQGRGCMLHSFALQNDIDYHDLKPFFCTIFPVTYYEGVLVMPEEIEEKTLACLGEGPTLYRGAREPIKYYFGNEIIGELDKIELMTFEPDRKSA